MTVEQFLELLKTKYSWPGGYPIYFIASDSESVCHNCATEEQAAIIEAITDNDKWGGWLITGYDVNYESLLYCAHCSQQIEAAYDVVMEGTDTDE